MSERIFIGTQGSDFLFRISPPGSNASNLTHPSVFSSSGEYLKIHTVIDETIGRHSEGGGWWHHGTWAFPDLGYVPYAFISISQLNRVFYPNDRNPDTSEMNNFWTWAIAKDRVWVNTTQRSAWGGDFRFKCIVFKNPASRTIP